MNKYNNGKIYKIVDNTNDNVYYGSTIRTLEERLAGHKRDKTCRSRLIINNGDYDIILVENYPCESKEQLESREAYYIINNNCVNIQIPGRTRKEYQQTERYKLWSKENRKNNKDKISKLKKEYYQQNKQKKLEYQKNLKQYNNSWCGDPRYNNNLLKIDVKLFL